MARGVAPMNPPAIQIENEIIPVTPSGDHEYTLPTSLVAKGYGVTEATIRKHKQNHADEILEGIHFLVSQNLGDGDSTGATNCSARNSTGVTNIHARQKGLKRGNDTVTHWTKLGVITLGFFIRSERAKSFRRAAAEMILSGMSQAPDTFNALAVVDEKIGALTVQDAGSVEALRGLIELRQTLARNEPISPLAGFPLRFDLDFEGGEYEVEISH